MVFYRGANENARGQYLPVLDEFRDWLYTEETEKLYKELVFTKSTALTDKAGIVISQYSH